MWKIPKMITQSFEGGRIMNRMLIKKILLILAGIIALCGVIATIIELTQVKGAGVAYTLFRELAQTCALTAIPGGFYAILEGQDMHMRHIGVSLPQPAPRPQYTQGGFQQQGGYQQSQPGGYQQPQQGGYQQPQQGGYQQPQQGSYQQPNNFQ